MRCPVCSRMSHVGSDAIADAEIVPPSVTDRNSHPVSMRPPPASPQALKAAALRPPAMFSLKTFLIMCSKSLESRGELGQHRRSASRAPQ